ncbi:hypothetical protein [Polyangium jinanense]|uniref:Uncharacterized protein n=1 Tax=Polyangium jinanense TaxID=2829994 RepID=A0A9X3XHS3_9BACT|nr:hypothetical protein [Polyangium jinanense]MDC3958394.1 hypothetical protein [Polyangium jinanense]MDC3988276.1 hypothetical protein [Polyangium jinanense]
MAMASPWGASKAIFVAGSLGILSGCGSYTSDYVPPKDGRARVLWDDDRVVASLPSEVSGRGCSEAIRNLPADPAQYSTYYGGSTGVVYYRPWIIVRPAPVVIVGSGGGVSNAPRTIHRTPADATVRSPSGGGSGSISGPGGGGGGGKSGGSSGGGGGGGGGGGDWGKAAVVVAVVALLTLPIITLSLGLTRPEPEGDVANAIDEVNAYNDLARLPGSPCAVEPAEVAQ